MRLFPQFINPYARVGKIGIRSINSGGIGPVVIEPVVVTKSGNKYFLKNSCLVLNSAWLCAGGWSCLLRVCIILCKREGTRRLVVKIAVRHVSVQGLFFTCF